MNTYKVKVHMYAEYTAEIDEEIELEIEACSEEDAREIAQEEAEGRFEEFACNAVEHGDWDEDITIEEVKFVKGDNPPTYRCPHTLDLLESNHDHDL